MSNMLTLVFVLFSLSSISLATENPAYKEMNSFLDKAVDILTGIDHTQEDVMVKKYKDSGSDSSDEEAFDFREADPFENADHSDDFDVNAHEKVVAFVKRNFQWA